MGRARDFTGSSFGGSENDSFMEEGPDPMGGVANIADAMLVFACGLMLAIVTFWNIDLPNIQQVIKSNEMKEVSDIEVTEDEMEADGSAYTQKGMVYEDPETGKLYMLVEDE